MRSKYTAEYPPVFRSRRMAAGVNLGAFGRLTCDAGEPVAWSSKRSGMRASRSSPTLRHTVPDAWGPWSFERRQADLERRATAGTGSWCTSPCASTRSTVRQRAQDPIGAPGLLPARAISLPLPPQHSGRGSRAARQRATDVTALVVALREVWEQWGFGAARSSRQFVDVGSGDGHCVVEVCRALPECLGVGFDIDSQCVDRGQAVAESLGFADRCRFRHVDVMNDKDMDMAGATAMLLSIPEQLVGYFLTGILPQGSLKRGAMLFSFGSPLPMSVAGLVRPLMTFKGEAPACADQRKDSMPARLLYCYTWLAVPPMPASPTGGLPSVSSTSAAAPSLSKEADEATSPTVIKTKEWKPRTNRGIMMKVRPSELYYSSPSISKRFSCGRDVATVIQDLKDGKSKVIDLPTISVVRRGERLLTLNHRRLYAFQQALSRDEEIEVRLLEGDQDFICHVPPNCKGYAAVYVDSELSC